MKLEEAFSEALKNLKKECDCEACSQEPSKEADISLDVIAVEGSGNHLQMRLENNQKKGTYILVSQNAEGADAFNVVKNDEGEYALRFNSKEAFIEFGMFVGDCFAGDE